MPKQITIIQGHPDPGGRHFCHALAASYAAGARNGGHQVIEIHVAGIHFPILRTREEWMDPATTTENIREAQEAIGRADHLFIIYPLWLGTMPALLKAFLEQTMRPGFAIGDSKQGRTWSKRLKGKSARVVVTMGMPAFFYRWYFRAHSLKSLERNILGFCGISPVRHTLIGMIEDMHDSKRNRWLGKMAKLGAGGR